MLRAFRKSDIRMKCNKYTEPYVENHIELISACEKRTLEINGAPVAILCFLNYNLDNYKGMFLISSDFNATMIEELKESIEIIRKELAAERLETESIDCRELNVWHRSLGFTLEGTKKRSFDGKDHNIWGIVWEQ